MQLAACCPVQLLNIVFAVHMYIYFVSIQNGAVAPASKTRIPPLEPEPAGFGHNDATVDIPLDTMNVMM